MTTGHSRGHLFYFFFPKTYLKKSQISQSSLLLRDTEGSVSSRFWRVVEAKAVKEELSNQSRGLVLQTELEFSGDWTQSIGHSHVRDYNTCHYQKLFLSDYISINQPKCYFLCFQLLLMLHWMEKNVSTWFNVTVTFPNGNSSVTTFYKWMFVCLFYITEADLWLQ